MAQRGEESSYSSSSSSVDSCEVFNVPFEIVVQKKDQMKVNLSGARFRACQVQIYMYRKKNNSPPQSTGKPTEQTTTKEEQEAF